LLCSDHLGYTQAMSEEKAETEETEEKEDTQELIVS
jgi:hypothetical protein